MIFVTLGTQAKDFSRLLKMVETLALEYNINNIIAQTGHTKYNSYNINCIAFVPIEQYDKYMSEADVVITHAGTGAIFSAIKKAKRLLLLLV